jgi:hypothetical protein
MTVQRFRFFAALWILGLFPVACSPTINEFTVWPRRICPDDTVHVAFDVSGKANLSVVTRSGSSADTITYTLVAERNGKTAFARQDVIRWLSPPSKELVFMTVPLGRDSVQAIDTLSAETWQSGLAIGSMASQLGRAITVIHAGIAVVIPGDGSPSMAFDGTPIYGAWELRAPLLPGEVMGDPAHPPPDRLRLGTTLMCNQNGSRP